MLVLIFVIGVIIGVVIGVFTTHRKSSGKLRVDRSDPTEQPYLFLELSDDMNYILHHKRVVFDVHVEDFLPHK